MDVLKVARPVAVSGLGDVPYPLSDPAGVEALLARCPVAAETPLVEAEAIAVEAGVAQVWVKDERGRMGLASFKALGAAHVIARHGAEARGRTYVTASAGNHGLSVAAGSAAFGARAVIYIAQTVPDAFAERLQEQGAEVRRVGETYEAAMAAAEMEAQAQGWHLLSDASWDGYTETPLRVMEGYLVLMAEAIRQMPVAPSHVFVQAGVGGLAAACAVLARAAWGDAPRIVVVEPEAAPCLRDSVAAGRVVTAQGPVSIMGRLDCKVPSHIALKGLARDADAFALITEEEAQVGAGTAMVAGLASTPSGAAGLSALLAVDDAGRAALELTAESTVLCVLSEGPET
ncbi:Diaminopropionate ammonia-lyase [Sulfitobacter sp. THAF37]|uniref:pyridoxal-phosphate dependent enzyme n=1 Tax=Sulfitobacter sp. THAF37 TaxID=2587855 RepID=UPI001267ED14|nr:pyridoxal-phosphate dependent enzyme [Sulfitobacter sp. THAF37]QFT57324.1 Diaminopropionate ammonia-lyase [Sulfitobacter sp. THAF37]